MSEIKETVTRSTESGISESGEQVEQQTKKIDTSVSASGRTVAENIIWFIYGTIAILLAFRFVLKLFGANPSNAFVDLIYSITGVLTAPFDSIFGVTKSASGSVSSVFEPSILVAIIVYGIVAWGIVKLINLNKSSQSSI